MKFNRGIFDVKKIEKIHRGCVCVFVGVEVGGVGIDWLLCRSLIVSQNLESMLNFWDFSIG